MFRRLAGAVASGVVLCALPGAAALAAAPPPIEAYGRLPGLEQVSVSPDGTRLAYIAAVGERRRLGVQTLDGKPLGAVDLGDQKVRSIGWGDDQHVLITTSSTTEIPFLSDTGEFYTAQSYNVGTRKFATLLNESVGSQSGSINGRSGSAGLNVVSGAPSVTEINGRPVVLVSGINRSFAPVLFRVDLDTGVGTPLGQDFGVLDPSGRTVAKGAYDSEAGRWRLQARDANGWRDIYVNTDAKIDQPSLHGFGRTRDTVLLSIPENGEDVLYEVALADGKKTKLDFGDEGEPHPIHNSRTGKLLGFAFLNDDRYEYLFTDPAIGRAWASIGAGFKGKNVQIEDWTPDYSKAVIQTDGADDPGTFLLVDVKAGRAVKIGSAYPDVPAEAVNEVKWISYKAADGMTIPAFVTYPRGRDPRNLPLIVLPHGGPQARDLPGFDWWPQALASRGYLVLQPQFRGSDGFGAAHLKAGYGQWGRKMQSDLSDGVRHLVSTGVADPKRVCIFGWSYGGYAAMAGPPLDPGVYRCAIAGAGVSDLRRMLAWEKSQTGSRNNPVTRYWQRFMGASRINDGSVDQVSPTVQAAKFDAPILLIHGKDDTVVPYEQSEMLAKALRRAGKPVEFVTLNGEDHWLSRGATRTEMLRASLAFLEKHNPPN